MVELKLGGAHRPCDKSFFTSRRSVLGLQEAGTPAVAYITGSTVMIDSSLSLDLGRGA